MFNTKTKELIICLIAIMTLILALTTNVFATIPDLNTLMNEENVENEFENILGTENTISNVNNKIENNVIKNVVNNSATTIPYTGIDYSIVVIIAICGVSAVYAYKKIRDYNV